MLTALLVACGAGDEANTSEGSAIREGQADASHAAVGVFVKGTSPECTGTLIARDVVLTAAHCAAQIRGAAFYLGAGTASQWEEREDGPEPVVSLRGRTKLELAETVTPPGYRDSSACPDPNVDVALVRLQSGAPASVRPARWAAHVPSANAVCTAVGFGAHKIGSHLYEYGARRRAEVKFERKTETTFAFSDSTGGTDAGDSGGPLLCGDQIVAVNSCGNHPDHFARLDKVADFIEETLRAWR